MRLRLLLVALILVLVSSCTTTKAYRTSLKDWTREKHVYSPITLNANLLWMATYLSEEFRSAARDQVNVWTKSAEYGNGPQPRYLMETTPGQFLVAIYIPRSWPQLTDSADSYWEFTLNLPNGQMIAPKKIETVQKTPREFKLLPHLDRWSILYKVTFPVNYIDRPFSLVLRSPSSTSQMDWDLRLHDKVYGASEITAEPVTSSSSK